MIAKRLVNTLALSVLIAPTLPDAQGFAGLGQTADDFARPDPAATLSFPQDHGAHPEFRIEWWYLTANLTGPDGTPYGLQWTLFRSALSTQPGTGWTTPQAWLGHAAVTTPDSHHATERWARGGTGQAGVRADPFAAWIDDWVLKGPLDAPTLTASGPDFAYSADLTANGPLILHGDAGYSVKSAEGQASHYYSQPHYTVVGNLTLPKGDIPVIGTAWLDREWSSQPLSARQEGWDWVALTFDSGARMMAFRLRGDTDFTSGTWIENGVGTPFATIQMTPSADIPPTTWRLRLPERDVDVTVVAVNPDAWMPLSTAYWEGPVTVSGSHTGVGYLEMTGYPRD